MNGLLPPHYFFESVQPCYPPTVSVFGCRFPVSSNVTGHGTPETGTTLFGDPNNVRLFRFRRKSATRRIPLTGDSFFYFYFELFNWIITGSSYLFFIFIRFINYIIRSVSLVLAPILINHSLFNGAGFFYRFLDIVFRD